MVSRTKKAATLSEEEIFYEKWGNPEIWNSLEVNIDDQHRPTQISNGITPLFVEASGNLKTALVAFLKDIPGNLLHKLSYNLRFAHFLYQFAFKLMEKSALIPQILQNDKDETIIRWIPALFDEEVCKIYEQLYATCPEKLVLYNNKTLIAQEQINSMISLICSNFMLGNYQSTVDRQATNDIFQLFFSQKVCKFTEFSKKEIPAVINHWLSGLYLSFRKHKLYLNIEDRGGLFDLSIKVGMNEADLPISIQQALATKDTKPKLSILSDLSKLAEYVPSLEASIDNGGGSVSFSLDDFAPLFLGILPVLKAIGIKVILPRSLQKVLKPQLNLDLKSKGKISNDRESFLNLENLLDFNWRIAIGDQKLTLAEFKSLLAKSRGLIKMVDSYVLLDEKEMQNLLKQLDKLPEHLSHSDLMQAALSGSLDGASVDLDQKLSELFDQISERGLVAVPSNIKAHLRPYQERGFNWLVQNIETGFGSILADDMGLGKTLQVISTIAYLKNQGRLANNKVLIIAPTSLLSNWQKEVERFAPDLDLLVYHGQNRELKENHDILITSYGLARRDKKELSKNDWFLLVIDEAQNIKNHNTDQTKAIKSMKAQHKIAMSGTPVENRLLEYWSIFDFTNKDYLGKPKQFKDRYASPIERDRDLDCLERFKKITSPFILRRLKSDKSIIQDLPDKIENNLYCSLTPEQTALYQEIVNKAMKKIEDSEGIQRRGLVLQLINALKQICNHPSQFGKKAKASIEQSGKLQSLEEIIAGIDESAEKALIFTQYTEMGDILSKLLEERFKAPVPFLHGGLSRKARDEMVSDFQNLSQKRILIVSLKAGGTGLNLTAANHVIHYDLWWNPAVEAQATDRAYRIGQKRNVMVHRLLTSGTFEERIDEMIKSKKDLANLTVESGESWITEMNTEQLKDMLSLRV